MTFALSVSDLELGRARTATSERRNDDLRILTCRIRKDHCGCESYDCAVEEGLTSLDDALPPPCPRCNQNINVRAVPPRVYGRYGPGTYAFRKRAREKETD